MSQVAAMIIAIAYPSLCGYIISTFMLRRDKESTLLEKVTLGFGLGFGLLSLSTFYMGALHVPFTQGSLIAVQAVYTLPVLLALIFLRRRASRVDILPTNNQRAHKERTLLNIVVGIILVWLALKAAFILIEAFNRPLFADDNWSNWSAGAKFFFYQGGFLLDTANEHFFAQGYRLYMGHPLLTPLLELWNALNLGHFDEILTKSWSPLYYIASIVLLYCAIKREAGRTPALMSAFMLSSVPLLAYHALDGYADLPLAFYVLAGSIFLFRYMEENSKSSLLLSGALFAIGAFTKNEGILFLCFAFLALILFMLIEKKCKPKDLLPYLIGAVLIVPWIIFKSSYSFGYGHMDASSGLDWTGTVHFEIFPLYAKQLFYNANHGLVFAFALVVSVLGYRTIIKSNIKYLYLIVGLMICSLLFLYATTMDFESVTLNTASNRNTLTFLPVTLYGATLVAIRFFKKDSQ